MLIHSLVNSCDITSERYAEPVNGGAHLAQGATGRWCEVLHVGPSELAKQIEAGAQVLSRDEAIKLIMAMPGHHTVDF